MNIKLGKYMTYWMKNSPRRMLHYLSYYKFAANLIGKNKRVLEVGCNEGLGSYLISKECGYTLGIDFDEESIITAKNNFTHDNLNFLECDFLKWKSPEKDFDAVICFDVIEHIYPENSDAFISLMQEKIKNTGLTIIGTPSLISQNFASDFSKDGHVNVYSPERLEEQLNKFFNYVFLFSANDEMVHTGFSKLAHYLIAVCC